MTKPKPTLLNKVLNYLSFRSRSKSEIVQYLEKKKASQSEIKEVVERLEELDLINDKGFASELIRSQIRKGNGPKKIYFNLLSKGVEKDVIQERLQIIEEEEWVSSATEILIKKKFKWENLEGFKQKQKIYSILQYRGHNSQTIKAVIDALPDQE